MNYIIALAFVITSLLSVLSFHLWISTLSSAPAEFKGERKERRRKMTLPSLSKPGMKVIPFYSRDFWRVYGAFAWRLALRCCLGTEQDKNRQKKAFVIMTLQLHIQGTEKLHAINNKRKQCRLWVSHAVFQRIEQVVACVGEVCLSRSDSLPQSVDHEFGPWATKVLSHDWCFISTKDWTVPEKRDLHNLAPTVEFVLKFDVQQPKARAPSVLQTLFCPENGPS